MAWRPFRGIRNLYRLYKGFKQLFKEVERLLDNAQGSVEGMRTPEAEIWETDSFIIIHMEISDIKKKDIKVDKMQNGLEIIIKPKKDYGYYKYVPLPHYAELKKADFSYDHNVLEVKVPKNKDKLKIK